MTDNVIQSLDTLTNEEKAVMVKILSELSNKGESEILNSIWNQDYDEIPVDIDTFIDDPEYFGSVLEGTLYPYWRNFLRKLFNPNSKYFEVIFSCLYGNTLVPTDKGCLKIKEIVKKVENGEELYAYSLNKEMSPYIQENKFSNKIYKRRIINGTFNSCRTTILLKFDNGKELQLTKEHKLLTNDLQWKAAGTLKTNDILYPNIRIKDTEYIATPLPVYDIEIEDAHHFLTDTGVYAANCSIGVGKSTVAGVAMAYVLYKLLCLKNPQKFYGISSSSKITMNFFNINLILAEQVTFGKFQSLITKSPWFLKHGTLAGGKGKPQLIPDKNIFLYFGSNSDHALGHDVFCLAGDTKILTGTGIENLKDIKNNNILTIDINENKLIQSSSGYVKQTLNTNEIIEIELEDNTKIICSPTHKFMTTLGEYKKAEDLKDTDTLKKISWL